MALTKKNIVFLLIILVFGQKIYAQKGIFRTQKGHVEFVSDAPLELISAASGQLKGILDPEKRTFSFVIPSRSFEGFNSPLQQVHFYENYIEATKFPEATFKGKIIEQPDFNKDGEYQVRAKGELDIHGVVQERIIRVMIRISKGVMYASSDFPILLKEHNINIPKVVNQKIAEEVTIHVKLEMIRK